MATSGFESAIDEHIERHINPDESSPEKAGEDGQNVVDSIDSETAQLRVILSRTH